MMSQWLEARAPDVIYCFGWSYLLKPNILKIPRLGVIGYHPAALPKNRGRHPIIWALALGLSETASSFFIVDTGADSGDLISQEAVNISNEDDAATLYYKLSKLVCQQISTFTEGLRNNTHQRHPQNHQLANNWRKRSAADGQIDWRMGAQEIYNLVRALTRPYVGAHCHSGGKDIKIWKCAVSLAAEKNCEAGKVLASSETELVIMCGRDALVLQEHEFQELPLKGSYL